MDEQEYVIRFDDVAAADANRYASELREAILDASQDVKVERRRDDPYALDFGATIVLVLGTPAVVAVARAIGNWIERSRGTITITRGDTRVEVKDVPGNAQGAMVDKLVQFFEAGEQR
jgi:hypothetical protein